MEEEEPCYEGSCTELFAKILLYVKLFLHFVAAVFSFGAMALALSTGNYVYAFILFIVGGIFVSFMFLYYLVLDGVRNGIAGKILLGAILAAALLDDDFATKYGFGRYKYDAPIKQYLSYFVNAIMLLINFLEMLAFFKLHSMVRGAEPDSSSSSDSDLP